MSQLKPDIDHLISLYLSGRASLSEQQELEQWLNASSSNREMFERLKEIWSMSSPDVPLPNQEQVRDSIWYAGTGKKRKD